MLPWDQFFREKIKKIFTDKSAVVDIGGGLRLNAQKGNRYNPSREWIAPLAARVKYTVTDAVADYHPDIVADIHNLPFADNSQDAIICIAVLEHVEDPFRASRELYRALKPGGYCFVYVPFLFYYHAEKGYYKDYWRFTEDALRLLFKKFSHIEIQSVRGAAETWLHLSPLGRIGFLKHIARLSDRVLKKKSKQVSGYHVFLIK